ncbi:fatty acid desaturase [Flavihumibacter petaseus]|uniref:Putative fatty acid desaturase n=1 Tax=Flavihumibacter petaseus NBRC 106054 TaxID=1220578 RepID=A0A0E9N1G1_9BACT|nr:fatty acid desaturase [Flavihumibacter petaseus]GAO43180.1 putative fatty acid desaturase [Flavihumibacter petaseus NBRC 106054]
MGFIDQLLHTPSYGWETISGTLQQPSAGKLFNEAASRINIFKSRTNWISLLSVLMMLCLVPFLYFFLFHYFSWWYLGAMLFYSLIVMGTHGTVWYHRYCTHKSFRFSNPVTRFIMQHLVIKTLPEEIYVVSHHVHHAKSDKPGDPYNAKGGLLYCMLAEFNHQRVSETLSETDHRKASAMLNHTGVGLNSFPQYKKWGSLTSPAYTLLSTLMNWIGWYTVFYLLGGHGLACALFSGAILWMALVRAFNYTGHAHGKEKHIDGVDFDRSNLSVNQTRPGLFTGEWHNNHHLYPGSARAGFLPHQVDLAWICIYLMYKTGAVASFHDSKAAFLEKYYSRQTVK